MRYLKSAYCIHLLKQGALWTAAPKGGHCLRLLLYSRRGQLLIWCYQMAAGGAAAGFSFAAMQAVSMIPTIPQCWSKA